jgi:hypothetical protein
MVQVETSMKRSTSKKEVAFIWNSKWESIKKPNILKIVKKK